MFSALKNPFYAFCLVFSLLITSYSANAADLNIPKTSEGTWQPLFNGKDLDDWTVKIKGQPVGHDPLATFTVEDGLLKVGYDEYPSFGGRFGHLFYKTPFSHYALNIEYRFVGEQTIGGPKGWAERNSGVMLHSQSPEQMSLEQNFPVAIEAQFLGGLQDERKRSTANVCTPGTDIEFKGDRHQHHCLSSNSKTYRGDQWVNVTVVVLGGGSITHYVEGEEVLRYEHPTLSTSGVAHIKGKKAGSPLQQGYIALQSESHPVEFRTVALLNLAGCTDPNAENYKVFAVKDDGSCQ